MKVTTLQLPVIFYVGMIMMLCPALCPSVAFAQVTIGDPLHFGLTTDDSETLAVSRRGCR